MLLNACKYIYDEVSLVWCVLYLYFVEDNLEKAIEQASSMYEYDFSLSPEFEVLLLKLIESRAHDSVIELAKTILEKFVLSTTNHVVLVAFMVDAKQISLNNASMLLNIHLDSEEKLNSVIIHALDVAWLTNEDEKDKFMSPDADDILFDALKKVKDLVLFAN